MRAYMEKLTIDPDKDKTSSLNEDDLSQQKKKEKIQPNNQPMETPIIRAGHSEYF